MLTVMGQTTPSRQHSFMKIWSWNIYIFCSHSFHSTDSRRAVVIFWWNTVGTHMTKWLGAQSLLLFLASLQVGFFRTSWFIPDGIFSNFFKLSTQYAENQALSDGVSAILQSVWFSGTFGIFSSKFMYIVPVTQIDSKNILLMFSRIRPDRRIALTPPERAWFFAYSALYVNKFHSVWIEIY